MRGCPRFVFYSCGSVGKTDFSVYYASETVPEVCWNVFGRGGPRVGYIACRVSQVVRIACLGVDSARAMWGGKGDVLITVSLSRYVGSGCPGSGLIIDLRSGRRFWGQRWCFRCVVSATHAKGLPRY